MKIIPNSGDFWQNSRAWHRSNLLQILHLLYSLTWEIIFTVHKHVSPKDRVQLYPFPLQIEVPNLPSEFPYLELPKDQETWCCSPSIGLE